MRKFKFKRTPPINTLMFVCYALMVVYAYASSNRMVNDTLLLMTIIIVIDGLYFWIVPKKIKIYLEIDEIVQKHELFKVKVKLVNDSLLPMPYMELVPDKGVRSSLEEVGSLGIMLNSKNQMECVIPYRAELCGLEEIGLEKIVFRSFFAFFKREVNNIEKVKVKILPKPRKLEYIQHFNDFLERLMASEIKQSGEEHLVIAGDEIGYELRPYVEGDSQRLIHWKIAAYKDELLVRQRQQNDEKKNNVFFILNPFLSGEEMEEAIIQDKLLTAFISLVGYYLEQEQRVQVAYYKDQTWQYLKIKSYVQLQQLQENLGDYVCLKAEKTIDQRSIIESFIKKVKQKGGIKILVSSYWTQEMEEYILSKKQNSTMSHIWTGSNRPRMLVQESKLPVWYLTDQYEMMLSETYEVSEGDFTEVEEDMIFEDIIPSERGDRRQSI